MAVKAKKKQTTETLAEEFERVMKRVMARDRRARKRREAKAQATSNLATQ